ncbi:MAG TPA: HAD family hydrolase [Candidatus Limnocylindria bacterium]
MIRALVFDFDGLILETEVPALESWAEIYREHGHEIPMDEWHALLGSARGFDPGEHLAALVGEGFDVTAARARRTSRRDELIAALDVMAGVREYVADARRMGLRLGVASSSTRGWVMGHLERLGIHEHWDVVKCREDVPRTKPAPDLYLATLDALSVPGDAAIAFEDSPNGIASAKAAGMWCVAVPNVLTQGLDLTQADVRLASLADVGLEELLRVVTSSTNT